MFRQTTLPPGNGNRPPSPSPPPNSDRDRYGFRSSPFDDTTHILILLVVLIPVIFTIVLCTVTYCIYRYNKKRSQRAPTNAPIDSSSPPVATIVYNAHHTPFMFEELPPSYDSVAYTKKADPSSVVTHEQVQLSVSPAATTTTSADEQVSAPAYSQLQQSGK